MPEYRVASVAKILGVSPDTVRRWVDAGRLRSSRSSSGQRVVDGVDLARFATELVVRQAPEAPRGQSARNHFPGIVTAVTKDGVAAQVELQVGAHRFVALITREAADDLGLEPGMIASAVVKATNVGIELLDEGERGGRGRQGSRLSEE